VGYSTAYRIGGVVGGLQGGARHHRRVSHMRHGARHGAGGLLPSPQLASAMMMGRHLRFASGLRNGRCKRREFDETQRLDRRTCARRAARGPKADGRDSDAGDAGCGRLWESGRTGAARLTRSCTGIAQREVIEEVIRELGGVTSRMVNFSVCAQRGRGAASGWSARER
jgi:hypothetical protein